MNNYSKNLRLTWQTEHGVRGVVVVLQTAHPVWRGMYGFEAIVLLVWFDWSLRMDFVIPADISIDQERFGGRLHWRASLRLCLAGGKGATWVLR